MQELCVEKSPKQLCFFNNFAMCWDKSLEEEDQENQNGGDEFPKDLNKGDFYGWWTCGLSYQFKSIVRSPIVASGKCWLAIIRSVWCHLQTALGYNLYRINGGSSNDSSTVSNPQPVLLPAWIEPKKARYKSKNYVKTYISCFRNPESRWHPSLSFSQHAGTLLKDENSGSNLNYLYL